MSSIFTKPDTIYSGYTGTPEKWVEFLLLWAEKISRKIDLSFNDTLLKEREEKIKQLETRLQIALPKSYRDFILATDRDWKIWQEEYCYDMLFKIEKIDWLNNIYPDVISAYMEPCYGKNYKEEDISLLDECSDENYFIYHRGQDGMRVSYLSSVLVIGNDLQENDRALSILNPLIKTRDREWEAWFFGVYTATIARFRSFAEMMSHFYISEVLYSDHVPWCNYEDDPYGIAKILFE